VAQVAELSERPWIKIVDVQSRGENAFIPALSFQAYGHGPFPSSHKQITLQLDIPIKNIGHSVAEITMDFELFLAIWKDDYADEITAGEKTFCDKHQDRKEFYPNALLFPDESFDWSDGGTSLILDARINQPSVNENSSCSGGHHLCRLSSSRIAKIYQTSCDV
jgi:hypothetical protein